MKSHSPRARRLLLAAVVPGLAYLLFWPVPVTPVAWDAPESAGFTGAFARNERLQRLEQLPIGANHGPETIAVDAGGRLYTATGEGNIVRLRPDGSSPEHWASTGGRPLGLSFDAGGTLFVADAFRGLLAISPGGAVRVVATEADGVPIRYANSVDVGSDGKVYFSDASTKFGAREWAGTYSASLLDILEHGGHGRLLVYDPASRRATTLIRGLNFANGVALAHDESFVLVAETGSYRVLRHWLAGPSRGRTEPLLQNLPGFPDNLSTGRDGRFWVALISPRNDLLDSLSGAPFARKVIQRLPAFIRPDAVAYGHLVAFDAAGNVLASLQDPAGTYRLTTGATDTDDYLYVGSLEMGTVGRVARPFR